MSSLQLPEYLEQPRVPPPYLVPPRGSWPGEQPTGPRKLARPVGILEDIHWHQLNREVPIDAATKGLEEVYVMDHRSAVLAFLEENRLRGLLLQALNALNATFGTAAVKTLSLVRDDEGLQTLFCLIMVPGDMQEARRALKSFDQQWWVAHSRQAAGKLNFDFELV